jgi:hypothetical protein
MRQTQYHHHVYYYPPQANGNNYQLLTEPTAPGAAAKRAMKAEAKRSFMLNDCVLGSDVYDTEGTLRYYSKRRIQGKL